eukprot:scaffold658349_cov62-Prasinocladus_malaysianus.AAC.1
MSSAASQYTYYYGKYHIINESPKKDIEVRALHSRHTGWAIPDRRLCAEVRAAVLAELLPRYRRFYDFYFDTYFTKNPSKYMVYTEAELRRILEEDFFSRAR